MKLTTKPSIDGAIGFIAKGMKQLDAVINIASATAQKAREKIAAADEEMRDAQADIEHAGRIKAKLAELVA